MAKKANKKSKKENPSNLQQQLEREHLESLMQQLLGDDANWEDEDIGDPDEDDGELNEPAYLALKARIEEKVQIFLSQEGIPNCDEEEDQDEGEDDFGNSEAFASMLQQLSTSGPEDNIDLDDEDGEFTFEEFQSRLFQLLNDKDAFQEFQNDVAESLAMDEDSDNSDVIENFRASSDEFVRSFSQVQDLVEKYGNPYDKENRKAKEKELTVLRKAAKKGSYDEKMKLADELHDYMVFLANWVDDPNIRKQCTSISNELTKLLVSVKSTSEELPPRQMLADHYLNLGVLALDDEEYRESVEYGEKALAEYKSLFESGSMEAYLDIAGTRLNLSNAYDQLEDKEKSIENALEAAAGFRYVLEQMQNDTGAYPTEENEIKIHLVKAMMVAVEPHYIAGAGHGDTAARIQALDMLDEMIKLLTPLAQLSNQKAYRFLTGALRMRFVLLDNEY